MMPRWKWAVDFVRVIIWALAAIGLAGIVTVLSMTGPVSWCGTEGCSIQGWVGAVSGSLAMIFALAAVVVSMQALRVQRKASEAELRAYMFTDRAEYDVANDTMEVVIRNCGATPALNLDIVLDLQLVCDRNQDLVADVGSAYKLGVVGPDKHHTLDWPDVASSRIDNLGALHRNTKHICVVGYIDYDDIFGKRHRLEIQTALTSDGKKFRNKLDIIRQQMDSLT
jgi:hypothetical protein